MGIWQLVFLGIVFLIWLLAVFMAFLRVPPLPTKAESLKDLFDLAKIKPNEVVVDLGCGDGRMLQIARDQYGAKISGWELNPVMWYLAKLRLGKKADIRMANLWTAPIQEADIVFVFLLPSLMSKVEKVIWPKLKPGTRIITNAFILPTTQPTTSKNKIYIYTKM